ncbi:MAG: metallophosphoesterase [Rickettsiales bacterium]|nr:metallophosphoesterase [Rickettsiales bacterium]
MHGQPQAYNNLIKQLKQYNITEKDIIIKNRKIAQNYANIYWNLLPDEGDTALAKQPINIGNKDVYALSDIEGYNIDFLDFLKKLGLVEYQEKKPSPLNGWKCCWSCTQEGNEVPVYYRFNERACQKFNDVIVLCGDYVRNSRRTSAGVVHILQELNYRLNNGKQEKNKGLYLLAGNHDIANYAPEDYNYFSLGDNPIDLKAKVLQLGLYPQLLLVNGDGKRLLFQHTNFPYREKNNYIVNKKIDPNKAIKLLNDKKAYDKPILRGDGFFNLRYIMPDAAQNPKYYDINCQQELPGLIYSDFGIGYDAKFIGHDGEFGGIANRDNGRGNVYNVNLNNKNEQKFEKWSCVKKEFNEQMKNTVNNLRKYYTKIITLEGKNMDEEQKKIAFNLAVLNALKYNNIKP